MSEQHPTLEEIRAKLIRKVDGLGIDLHRLHEAFYDSAVSFHPIAVSCWEEASKEIGNRLYTLAGIVLSARLKEKQ